MAADGIKVLFFDVFGTVVDWRSGVIRELEAFGEKTGADADWAAFADEWRAMYQPSMDGVRRGNREWRNLDALHRESLITLLTRNAITSLSEAEIDHLVRAWHRLAPWPDAVEGLTRLKARHIIATLSNGNVALLVNMARRAGLPWDTVLGAETARAYKPMPEAYLTNAQLLDAEPAQCLMVAAHNHDLAAARELGFRTAFVRRPKEHGPNQTRDLEPEQDWDFTADSFTGLADALEC